ncbi:nucleotidyltransferase domain-containing protein [Enterococcus innesii]|nr:nucleotidyltransferase family protein [Enterococcus innesii]
MNDSTAFIAIQLINKVLQNTSKVDFSSAIKWQEVFSFAKDHRLSSITFYALEELVKEKIVEIDEGLYEKWRMEREKQRVINLAQLYEIQKLEGIFEKQNIPYLLFKGSKIKELYPKSDMREMTDIDILLQNRDMKKTCEIFRNNDYMIDKEYPNGEIQAIKKPFVLVELHDHLFFRSQEKFYKYFKLLTDTMFESKQDKNELCWDKTDEYVYIFCHFYKHFSNRGAGIRYFVDLWLFKKKFSSEIDWIRVNSELQKLGLLTTYEECMAINDNWFKNGIRSPNLELEKYIFSSGVYGTFDHFLDNNISRLGGTTKYIISRIFPAKNQMMHVYPEMNNSSIFLSYYWIKRWGQILMTRRERVTFEMKYVFKRFYNQNK